MLQINVIYIWCITRLWSRCFCINRKEVERVSSFFDFEIVFVTANTLLFFFLWHSTVVLLCSQMTQVLIKLDRRRLMGHSLTWALTACQKNLVRALLARHQWCGGKLKEHTSDSARFILFTTNHVYFASQLFYVFLSCVFCLFFMYFPLPWFPLISAWYKTLLADS